MSEKNATKEKENGKEFKRANSVPTPPAQNKENSEEFKRANTLPAPTAQNNINPYAKKNAEEIIKKMNSIDETDVPKGWTMVTSSKGAKWPHSDTYNKLKIELKEYFKIVIDKKQNVGAKKEAAKKFEEYSNRIKSTLEKLKKEKPAKELNEEIRGMVDSAAKLTDQYSEVLSQYELQKSIASKCEELAKEFTIQKLIQELNKKDPGKLFSWNEKKHGKYTLSQTKFDVLSKILELKKEDKVDSLIMAETNAQEVTLEDLSKKFSDMKDKYSKLSQGLEETMKKYETEIEEIQKQTEIKKIDLQMAKKELNGDFNGRKRKAFRIMEQVLEGNLFQLLTDPEWSPYDAVESPSKYESVTFIKKFGKSILSNAKKVLDYIKSAFKSKANTEEEKNIKKEIKEWNGLGKFFIEYQKLDKNITGNYLNALLAKASLDNQYFSTNWKGYLDKRAGSAGALASIKDNANNLNKFLVDNGLSPKNGPYLCTIHPQTGRVVLNQNVMSESGFGSKDIKKISDKLGISLYETEDKLAKKQK